MTYRTKTTPDLPILLSFYLLLMLTNSLLSLPWTIFIVTIGFGLVILIMAMLRYEVTIEDTKIRVVSFLFSFQLIERTYYARNMKKIKFKRVGWQSQGATLHMDYAITFRLPHYSPAEAYEVLDQFAVANNIQVFKTNDYKIVEKMIKNKKTAQKA